MVGDSGDWKIVDRSVSVGDGLTAADKGRLRLAQMALEARTDAQQMMVNASILENVIVNGSDKEVFKAIAALAEAELTPEREEMN